jgi:hypothetical protein
MDNFNIDNDTNIIIENTTKKIVEYLLNEGISQNNLDTAFSVYLTYSGNVINSHFNNFMNVEMVKILYMKKFNELYK